MSWIKPDLFLQDALFFRAERVADVKSKRKTFAVDVEHLRDLEFGDKSEAIVRLTSVGIAGVLIYLYTGWILALVWSVYFAAAWCLHSYFVFTRGSQWSKLEIIGATALFANLQVAFGWHLHEFHHTLVGFT